MHRSLHAKFEADKAKFSLRDLQLIFKKITYVESDQCMYFVQIDNVYIQFFSFIESRDVEQLQYKFDEGKFSDVSRIIMMAAQHYSEIFEKSIGDSQRTIEES